MRVTVLPFEDWSTIADIVTREFNDGMPTSTDQATFAALMDGDKLAAFLHVEKLYHFNSLYVMPDYRKQGCARQLLRSASASIPEHESAIWLGPTDRGEIFARGFGFRDLGIYRVFRKDR